MRKVKRLSFVFLVVFCFVVIAFSSKLSPELQIVVDLYKKGKLEELRSLSFVVVDKTTGEYVDVLAEFDGTLPPELLSRCRFARKYPGNGNFYHLQLPIGEVEKLSLSSSLRYMKLSKPLKLFMDKVRQKLGLEGFYNYTYLGDIQGRDVIIGIIDTGIDTSHWDFWGNNVVPRILYIWDQTTNGRAPQGFDYGNEITDRDITANPFIGTDEVGHGTHVAGIAGGNGNESGGKYRGIASSSKFVIVKTTLGISQILDGINYILFKAKTLGKPCVINLSLGSDIGSHDGKDLEHKILKEIIDYYGRKGNVIVAASGNSGDIKIHYSNTISSVLPSVAIVRVTTNIPEELDEIHIDSWFDFSTPTQKVEVNVVTPSGNSTGWITFPTSSYSISTSEGKIMISSTSNKYNGSGNIYIVISDSSSSQIATGNWRVQFRTTEDTSLLHSWIAYTYGVDAYFFNGDNYYTVSSSFLIDDVIIVGAFATKTNIKSVDDGDVIIQSKLLQKVGVYGISNVMYGETIFANLTNDNICYFSSLGPTRDGRQKPDVAAPGALIVSALSTWSLASDSFIVDEIPGKYRYVAMMGTSMAAPVVTGVAALLLGIDGSLTSQDVINYLKTYSLVSHYDSNGKSWDPAWGHGMLSVTNIFEVLRKNPTNLVWLEGNVLRFSWGVNSFNVKIRTDTSDSVDIYLYNMRGNLIKYFGSYQVLPGVNTIPVKLKENEVVKDNVYMLRVSGKKVGSMDFKIVVIR